MVFYFCFFTLHREINIKLTPSKISKRENCARRWAALWNPNKPTPVQKRWGYLHTKIHPLAFYFPLFFCSLQIFTTFVNSEVTSKRVR